MLNAIAASGREAGLEVNVEKTNVLILGALAVAHPTLSHDGVPIERLPPERTYHLSAKPVIGF
jgi:hypothetical protein